MKTIVLFLAMLISGIALAQTGINYKAIVKDGGGNVLANETINIRFSIVNDTEVTTVYQERFLSEDTNENGLIILDIGGGIPSIGFFSDVQWNSGNLFSLRVEVDLIDGNGYINMGTSQFNTVPFAQAASSIMNIPTRTLEVAGIGPQKMRINSENGNEAALELMREGSSTDWKFENSGTWLDIKTSDNDFTSESIKFSFHRDGRFGVNNANPVEELHVNGTIRSTDLAGAGNRKVLANADGNLIIETPVTKYLSINPVSFNARTTTGQDPDSEHTTGNWISGLSGDTIFEAPVNLPHTATITNMWVHYVDGSASSNILFRLKRMTLSQNTETAVANATSSGSSTAHRFVHYPNINHLVNNFSYSYIIQVYSTNWQSLMYVTGVVIGYTE